METRSFDVKAKAKKLVGYALKFGELGKIINQRGEIEYERITKGALKNANLDNVILNINHDDNYKLASTQERNLNLSIDDIGLKVEATLGDDEFSNKVYDLVKRGLIDQMSFRAEFLKRKQAMEEDVPVFLVEELGRFEDVSIVDIPAYKSAEIQARSKGVERMENKEQVVEETKKEETESTAKVDETVVEETANEVKTDIQENAEESGINYDLLAEKVAEKLQPKQEEKTEEKKEEVEERSMNKFEQETVKMEDVNKMQATNVDVRSTNEYKAVWAEAIKKNDMSIAKDYIAERGAGLATNGANGESNLVPTELQNYIETALREGGRIASLCNIVNIHGLYSVPVEVSATDASIHVEGSPAPTEETITFGEVLINADYIKKWISVTDKMLSMTNIDLANYLIDELKNKILEFLDELVISGTGSVKGITKVADDKFVKALTVDKKNLANAGFTAQGSIQTAGTPTIVMNRSFFFNVIMDIKDSTGRPMAVQNITNDKAEYWFNGMPIVLSNSATLANTAEESKPAMIIGDFKGYLLNCPNGANVEIITDSLTQARENKVLFIGKLLAGGNVTKLHSFATITVNQA